MARLRAGDERAFEALVDSHHPTMLAVARTYVKSRAVAEEVVQDAWVGVLNGLDRFEGRSSLKTWILRIVVNTAMTRGGREARSVPFSARDARRVRRQPAGAAAPGPIPRARCPGEALRWLSPASTSPARRWSSW